MKMATAKQLKNQTGEALRHVVRGRRVLITRRGKPVAVLAPIGDTSAHEAPGLRPFSEAWADIEAQLKATTPPFPTWKEALRWSRRRG